MRLRKAATKYVFALVIALGGAAAAADDALATAYAAILKGDYDAGKATIDRIRQQGPAAEVSKLETWLKSFQDLSGSRKEMNEKTFAWNVLNAQKSIADADRIAAGIDEPALSKADRELAAARKLYLGLSFAAQAHYYAADKDTFAKESWIRELREKVLKSAAWWGGSKKWSKATAYYALMERIDGADEEVKKLREMAGRHARMEYVYRTAAEADRRLAGVEVTMLDTALKVINDLYFKEPDFRKMAGGAIDNLVALCNTTKLYDVSKVFSGVASQPLREAFLSRLEELRKKVTNAKSFQRKDLYALFNSMKKASDETVSLPEPLLVIEFTEGALGELDQFTSMIWPVDAVDFDKQMMGHFYGVGIQLGVDEVSSRLKAVTPLEDSPALKAGIQPDDLIIEVNGETTKGWTTDEAIRKITGEEGTSVTLTMLRPSTGEKLTFPLTRRNITIKTVRGVNRVEGDPQGAWNYILDPVAGIGYIKLSGFTGESATDLHAAMERATAQGMKGLILDLRFNPGGLLDVAVATVSEFVRRGSVVSTRGRQEERQKLDVNGDADYADLPLVVLVNDSSASASEILSGALQDHARAAVLGERTFGKGSVQKVLNLERPALFGNRDREIARLKITTALYYLPNGRSPHKLPDATAWGVDPDINIELTPKEITKVFERDRKSYIIHNEARNSTALSDEDRKKHLESVKAGDASSVEEDEEREDEDLLTKADIEALRADPYKAPDSDPQLETALLQLRVKLAGDLPWPRELAKNTTPTKDDKR